MRTHPEQKFYYGLARELGMTVGRMLSEMDSLEVSRWMAFFAIEEEERKKPKQEDPKSLAEKIKTSLGGFGRGGKKSR